MRRKLIILVSIMVIIIMATFTITFFVNKNDNEVSDMEDNSISVVTSFYPVYVLTQNLADQISDIKVDILTDFSAGCLHDYQLTTDDMKVLSDADVFIINGGGMEDYLEDVMDNYPDITVIDLSQDIPMIESMEHEGEDNPHVWLDPQLYMIQIENASKGLEQYIKSIGSDSITSENNSNVKNSSKNKSKNISADKSTDIINKLSSNTNDYLDKVQDIVDDMNLILDSVKDRALNNDITNKVVIFHDSFAYLADKAGLEVAYAVEIDEEHPLSAGEIAEVIDIINDEGIRYLFTEKQHDGTISDRIKEETGADIYIIDSAVTGDGSKDSYLEAMRHNIDTLNNAFEQ